MEEEKILQSRKSSHVQSNAIDFTQSQRLKNDVLGEAFADQQTVLANSLEAKTSAPAVEAPGLGFSEMG